VQKSRPSFGGKAMPDTIVIHSASARDILPEETKAIAEAVQQLNKDFEVKIADHEQSGAFVTWFEVLRITLVGGAFGLGKPFSEEIVKRIADIVVEWARQRFKKRLTNSPRPVYLAIAGPDGLLKSLVINNCVDEAEDLTEHDRQTESSLRARIAKEAAQPAPSASSLSASPTPRTCGGQHRCPVCHQAKRCALGTCTAVGDVKCDPCLYVEEYGPKAAKVIEKAIAVASHLQDASNRATTWFMGNNAPPWASKEEAGEWADQAHRAVEELDTAIGIVALRFNERRR
jgi:hypothetical protein